MSRVRDRLWPGDDALFTGRCGDLRLILNALAARQAKPPSDYDVFRVAVALWIEDARRAAPLVANQRNADMFREQSAETLAAWLGLARAAVVTIALANGGGDAE